MESSNFLNNDDFCEWLFSPSNAFFTAIAHNFQGYDGIFIMNYIKQHIISIDIIPSIIMNGSKILTLSFRNVRLIDSYSFLPMSLENFSKTFSLHELKKGFFPHKFNNPDQYYIGNFPENIFLDLSIFLKRKNKNLMHGMSKTATIYTIFKKKCIVIVCQMSNC